MPSEFSTQRTQQDQFSEQQTMKDEKSEAKETPAAAHIEQSDR